MATDSSTTQDILLTCSTAVTAVKLLTSLFGFYGKWQMLFSNTAFGLTLAAFVLFLINNDLESRRDKASFILSFITCLAVEMLSTLLTCQTVTSYKKVEARASGDDAMLALKSAKMLLRKMYWCCIIFALLFEGIFPLVGFAKASWDTELVVPSDFNNKTSKLLLAFRVMGSAPILYALFQTIRLYCRPLELLVNLKKMRGFFGLPLFIAGILGYVALGVVPRGTQAGSLTYLVLILSVQIVEYGGEYARFSSWVALSEQLPAVANAIGVELQDNKDHNDDAATATINKDDGSNEEGQEEESMPEDKADKV